MGELVFVCFIFTVSSCPVFISLIYLPSFVLIASFFRFCHTCCCIVHSPYIWNVLVLPTHTHTHTHTPSPLVLLFITFLSSCASISSSKSSFCSLISSRCFLYLRDSQRCLTALRSSISHRPSRVFTFPYYHWGLSSTLLVGLVSSWHALAPLPHPLYTTGQPIRTGLWQGMWQGRQAGRVKGRKEESPGEVEGRSWSLLKV